MYRTVAAVLISMLFAAPALAQSACGSSGSQQRRETARGCGKDCICDEVQEGFM